MARYGRALRASGRNERGRSPKARRALLWVCAIAFGGACGGGSSGPAPLGREVPFKWVDTSAGDRLALAGNDAVEQTLDFAFRYFGTEFDRVVVSANGFVAFDALGAGSAANTPLPDPAAPNGVVAPLWDALALVGDAEVRSARIDEGGVRSFVAEWRDVRHADAPDGEGVTFQVIVEETGAVLMSYRRVSFGDPALDGGASATVGVENPSGTAGFLFSFEQAALRDNMTLRFGPGEIAEEIFCADADGDGFSTDGGACGRLDCDDTNPAVRPGATELCNGVDDNCDGVPDDDDADGDGVTVCGGDCDDADPAVRPGAVERCNGVDDDCDEAVDEGFDADGDGFTTCGGDCDDGNEAVRPGATELCNEVDDDCDGAIDEGFDADGDGFTTCGGDCDDGNAEIRPGATEVCNLADDDCDGTIDEGFDGDGDGFTICGGDCNDEDPAINPRAREIPNDGIDQNCNGSQICGSLPGGGGGAGALGSYGLALGAMGMWAWRRRRGAGADVST